MCGLSSEAERAKDFVLAMNIIVFAREVTLADMDLTTTFVCDVDKIVPFCEQYFGLLKYYDTVVSEKYFFLVPYLTFLAGTSRVVVCHALPPFHASV